ncbi:MAG: nuclear transport factor 2 family protein [Desulfatibacillum sp.]|nr:nuclear transport factor 2 family protein [Desulfatibacillum sp.]
MTDQRARLYNLSSGFADAFNRGNLDDIMDFFAQDAILEDSTGGKHKGKEAIRAAFRPLVDGGQGKIRFDLEDFFTEVETKKVMIRWTLHTNMEGDWKKRRGMDILRFSGDKIVEKLAYTKAEVPVLSDGP